MSAVDDYREADSKTTYTTPQEAATARKARAAIAELEAEKKDLQWRKDEMTKALQSRIAELESERERWVWTAHMVWSTPDPNPTDICSYPMRLSKRWHPGRSYHSGQFQEEIQMEPRKEGSARET
jgi:hypothetical protein